MSLLLEPFLLYRDGLILVLNKPAGLPVHKGRGPYRALEEDFDQLQFGLPRSPSLAHRLDRETSGCLVLGRHPKALKLLGELFKKNLIQKTYLALVEGELMEEEGVIDVSLSPRSEASNTWWMKADPNGKPAVTTYKVLACGGRMSFLELKPLTGRTHQLRVHCAHLGHPILGDKIYGHGNGREPLLLHAVSLLLPLSKTKPPLFVEAPLPETFSQAFPLLKR